MSLNWNVWRRIISGPKLSQVGADIDDVLGLDTAEMSWVKWRWDGWGLNYNEYPMTDVKPRGMTIPEM